MINDGDFGDLGRGSYIDSSPELEALQRNVNAKLLGTNIEQANENAQLIIDVARTVVQGCLNIDRRNIDLLNANIADGSTRATMLQFVVPHELSYPADIDGTLHSSLSVLSAATVDAPKHEVGIDIERIDLAHDLQGFERAEKHALAVIFGQKNYTAGDRLNMSIPVSDTYHYPEPLGEESTFEDEEPQALVEYMRAGESTGVSFLIKPKTMYSISSSGDAIAFDAARYESAFDTGRQYIEGEEGLSDEVIFEGISHRTPHESIVLSKLAELVMEFTVTPQVVLGPNGKQEL